MPRKWVAQSAPVFNFIFQFSLLFLRRIKFVIAERGQNESASLPPYLSSRASINASKANRADALPPTRARPFNVSVVVHLDLSEAATGISERRNPCDEPNYSPCRFASLREGRSSHLSDLINRRPPPQRRSLAPSRLSPRQRASHFFVGVAWVPNLKLEISDPQR